MASARTLTFEPEAVYQERVSILEHVQFIEMWCAASGRPWNPAIAVLLGFCAAIRAGMADIGTLCK
jgi:hypothetical protein